MTHRRFAFGIGACVLGVLGGAGCRGDSSGPGGASGTGTGSTSTTEQDIPVNATRAALAAVQHAQQTFKVRSGKLAPHSVLKASPVERFTTDGETFHAVGPSPMKASQAIDARIPRLANGATTVEWGGVRVDSVAKDLGDATLEWAQHIGVYRDAAEGVNAYRRVDGNGVEDFYEVASPRDMLQFHYEVSLKNVAGLRLVGGSLALLDASGTPRLVMPAPVATDAKGVQRLGEVTVEGCAYDANPIGPWGRPVTPPGASSCSVTATMDGRDLAYPVLVDPAWRATFNTVQDHAYHKMFVLPAGTDSGKVLLVGGTGSAPRVTELFDPATNTWTAAGTLGADFGPGCNAAVLSSGVAIVGGGYPLAGTGTALKSVQKRDATTGVWSATGPLGTARTWFAMETVTIGGVQKVLAAGGFTSDSATTASKNAELFDPAGGGGAGTWTATASMAVGHFMPASAKLSTGKVLVAGGLDSPSFGSAITSVDLFDPTTSTWSSSTLTTARGGAVAVPLAGGAALVAGGETDDFGGEELNTAEVYSGTGFTALSGTMVEARFHAAGVLLDDGKALITGGQYVDTFSFTTHTTSSADLFDPGADPKTGTLLGTAIMGTQRVYHAMANITGKGALATGGLSDDGTGTMTENAISEIFDTTLGAPCGSGCPSGTFCTEGVCCESASCPEGETCASPGHEGVCARPKGSPCSTGSECSTGYCVESVCCDAPCTGDCQSCTATGKVGTCTMATPGTDPGGKCAAAFGGGDPICGPFCDSTGYCGAYAASGTLCGSSADAGPDSGPFCTRNECDDFGTCAPSTFNCGLTCTTTVTCDEASKTCTPSSSGIKAGYCVMDHNCWTYGDIDPTDPTHCRQCNPPVSKTSWFDSCAETGPDTGTDTGVGDAKADGVADTKVDSGTDAKADAHDAAPDTGVAADSSVADSGTSPDDSLPESSTCSCRVPGGDEGARGTTSGALVAAAGLGIILGRRRRRR